MNLTKFDRDFVNKLIKQKEGKSLDFKQKITSKEKIAKTLVAMANTEGGLLVIGLSDKKKVIGIDPDEEQYMVAAANEEHCLPRVSISLHTVKIMDETHASDSEHEEKYLLLVEVMKTQGPEIQWVSKTGEKKVFIRKDDQTLAV